MSVGRPTKYEGDETIRKAEAYLASCVDEPVIVKNEKGETKIVGWKVHLPKTEGLAIALNIHRDTVIEWAKEYPAFSDILDKILKFQASKVIDEALGGYYNPLIAKLLLGKHGYKEEKDITSGGKTMSSILDDADSSPTG